MLKRKFFILNIKNIIIWFEIWSSIYQATLKLFPSNYVKSHLNTPSQIGKYSHFMTGINRTGTNWIWIFFIYHYYMPRNSQTERKNNKRSFKKLLLTLWYHVITHELIIWRAYSHLENILWMVSFCRLKCFLNFDGFLIRFIYNIEAYEH